MMPMPRSFDGMDDLSVTAYPVSRSDEHTHAS
jgi:hypothetical protein